jgi:hypothetical protein
VPIVFPLSRSAVLPSETATRSLLLLALGCLKPIKGNVPGFFESSTPVGPAEQAVCISVGEEEGHRDLGLFNDVPVRYQGDWASKDPIITRSSELRHSASTFVKIVVCEQVVAKKVALISLRQAGEK